MSGAAIPPLPGDELARIAEAAAVGLLVLDADGSVRSANAQARRLLSPHDGVAFGGAAPRVHAALARVCAGGSEPPFRIACPSDAGCVLELALTPLAPGGPVLVTAVEVTERERLRAALERRARELAAIFDATPSTVRIFDADGRLVRFNRAAQLEHDSSRRPTTLDDLLALDAPVDAASGAPLPPAEHPACQALAGASPRMRLLRLRRGDGGKVVESHATPVRDAGGRIVGVALVDRDVTEREALKAELAEQLRHSSELNARVSVEASRLERMVEQRSRELLAMQESRARERRLAALGQLAAGVMHDVNNALNPIMAAAWLLGRKADDPDAVRDYAQRIHRAAETGAATAARVGRFIRQDPLDVSVEEVVHLPTLADEVVQLTRPLWAERLDGGTIRYGASHHPGAWIRALGGEVREALLNLVHNALDAMPTGGLLTIVTGCDATDAWVEVRDTGVGMSDEVRERAFEPFFSTKGAAGSGLGLAEVYGIARRHRGHAEIDSTPGRGTAVRLRFPRVAPAPAAEPRPAPPGPGGRLRVLFVEDHPDGRDFVASLLGAGGHEVETVTTVHEARARLLAQEFDVLLTDLGLPDGSGWDLVSLARDRRPAMRRVVVTGWEPRLPDAGGAHVVLRKPVAAAALLAALAENRPPAEAAAGPRVTPAVPVGEALPSRT